MLELPSDICHRHLPSPVNTLKLKKTAPSGTIVLNRPEKRNAITREMMQDLLQALDDFHGERDVRAVILTGSGVAFCAGMDLGEMQETAGQPDAWKQWHEDAVAYREVIDRMMMFPKPIIAAVNGPAMAGGLGLVLASDLVISAKEATFAVPEPKRGIVAGIVSPLLVFRIGASHAANLLLTARTIGNSDAVRMGLVHETVGVDMTWVRAHEIAQEVAKSAPEAILLTKKLLNETIGEHLGTLLSAGAAASATARTTEAAAEGMAAFLEKREPKWL
jgi:methylglutaconyl-CoA hydratase